MIGILVFFYYKYLFIISSNPSAIKILHVIVYILNAFIDNRFCKALLKHNVHYFFIMIDWRNITWNYTEAWVQLCIFRWKMFLEFIPSSYIVSFLFSRLRGRGIWILEQMLRSSTEQWRISYFVIQMIKFSKMCSVFVNLIKRFPCIAENILIWTNGSKFHPFKKKKIT